MAEKFQTVKVSLDCGGNSMRQVQLELYKVNTQWLLDNTGFKPGRMVFNTDDQNIYISVGEDEQTLRWSPLLENVYLSQNNLNFVSSGGGNAVTSIEATFNNGKATITSKKEKTFLTEHQEVINKDATIPRTNTLTTIATVGGTDIKVKEAPISVSNKGATLGWGANTTIATIEGTNITAKLPANPNTINQFRNMAIIGTATDTDQTVQELISSNSDAIFTNIARGVAHFDLFRTTTNPRFFVIGLGQDYLLSFMRDMLGSIQTYCSSIGAITNNREIVFHFQMDIPSLSSTEDDFIHIPIAIYNANTQTFSTLGTTYDTQLYGYYILSHNTSGQLFNCIDIQIRFTFGTSINDGSIIYCSMTPTITFI